MTVSLNSVIQLNDYNYMQSEVSKTLGTGTNWYGYGQHVFSSQKQPNSIISQQDWDNLKADIDNIRTHQGIAHTIPSVNEHQLISLTTLYPYIQGANDLSGLSRFLIGAGQYLTTNTSPSGQLLQKTINFSNGNTWSKELTCTIVIEFPTADNARYFFNSGGQIDISATRIPTTLTNAQAQSWAQIMSKVGLNSLKAYNYQSNMTIDGSGYNIRLLDFYTLTNNFQSLRSVFGSYPFDANSFEINVKCDVDNNANGTAKIITIQVRFVDRYSINGNAVDGNFSVNITEKLPTGTMTVPPSYAGNPITFNITRPSYIMSDIISVGGAEINPYTYATGGTISMPLIDGQRYRIHTFTSSGTLSIINAGQDPTIEYLIVGGGGGGGGGGVLNPGYSTNNVNAGGGGGAGGFRTGTTSAFVNNFSVVVGNGGAGGLSCMGGSSTSGSNGGNSSVLGIVSVGGGGGGRGLANGASGGSGGGSGGRAYGNNGIGGQGNNGGSSVTSSFGSGGGGASTNGGVAYFYSFDLGTYLGPANGTGLTNSITGSAIEYSSGGGGGGPGNASAPTAGGIGGGFINNRWRPQPPGDELPNTGNGGSGGNGYYDTVAGASHGGRGGSGIVIIRYRIA